MSGPALTGTELAGQDALVFGDTGNLATFPVGGCHRRPVPADDTTEEARD